MFPHLCGPVWPLHTRSMVHEGTQITQTTEGQGSADTLQNDEFEMPLVGFLNRKKQSHTKRKL